MIQDVRMSVSFIGKVKTVDERREISGISV